MHHPLQLRWRSNSSWFSGASLCLGCLILGMTAPAQSLPGQTVDEVVVWIQAHPTLQPAPNERLRVRKSDTPAHRFMFAALPFAPGRAETENGNLIRMEQLSFFDRTTGVSPARLQEAIQVIYGAEVYQDYQQSSIIYQYPDPISSAMPPEPETPLRESLQGEVRQGDRYAYWLETAPTSSGVAYSGQISVFLIEDIERLVSALQRR